MKSLPPIPGFDDVSGAVVRGQWAFCWHDGDAAFWSVATGCVPMSRSPRPLLKAVGFDEGIALLRAESTVEFLGWGDAEPLWSREIGLPYGDTIHLAASFVIHGTRDNVVTTWTAEEIRPAGLGTPFAFDASGREPPLALLARPGGLPPLVVDSTGIAPVPLSGGKLEPRRVGLGEIDGPSHLIALPRGFPDVAVFALRWGPALLVRAADASDELIGPRTPPGFEELWRAWLAGDWEAIGRILAIWAGEPPPLEGDGPFTCLGLVFDDAGLPVAAASHEGIVDLAQPRVSGESRRARSWAQGSACDDDLLCWGLYAGDPEAFDLLLSKLLLPGRHTPRLQIGLLLAREHPLLAGRALLAQARGRRPAEDHRSSRDAFRRLLGAESGISETDLLAEVAGGDPLVSMISALGLLHRWEAEERQPCPPGPLERAPVLALLTHGDPVVRSVVLEAALDADIPEARDHVLPILRAATEEGCFSVVRAVVRHRSALPEVVADVLAEARRSAPGSALRRALIRQSSLEALCPGPESVPVVLDLMAGVDDLAMSTLVTVLAGCGSGVSLGQATEALARILSRLVEPRELPGSNYEPYHRLRKLADGWSKEPAPGPPAEPSERPLTPALFAVELASAVFAAAWNLDTWWSRGPSGERPLFQRSEPISGSLGPLVDDLRVLLASHLPPLARLARAYAAVRRLDHRLAALLAATILLAPAESGAAEPPAGASLARRLRIEGERNGPRRELVRLAALAATEGDPLGEFVRRSLEAARQA